MEHTQTAKCCHFMDCRNAVTHTVQRLWTPPNREPFALQYSCADHLPGSALFANNEITRRFLNAGKGLTPFYRVEPLAHVEA